MTCSRLLSKLASEMGWESKSFEFHAAGIFYQLASLASPVRRRLWVKCNTWLCSFFTGKKEGRWHELACDSQIDFNVFYTMIRDKTNSRAPKPSCRQCWELWTGLPMSARASVRGVATAGMSLALWRVSFLVKACNLHISPVREVLIRWNTALLIMLWLWSILCFLVGTFKNCTGCCTS